MQTTKNRRGAIVAVPERDGLIVQGQRAQYWPCTLDTWPGAGGWNQVFDKLAAQIETVCSGQ